MDNLWLFAHVTSLGIWLGSLVLLSVFILIVRKQLVSADIRRIFIKFTKVFNGISHLMATIVLVSGVVMMLQRWGEVEVKPFWITFMERAGGTAVLISIIALTFLGRRITKQLSDSSSPKQVKGFGAYLSTMAGAITLIVAVIFVVTFQI